MHAQRSEAYLRLREVLNVVAELNLAPHLEAEALRYLLNQPAQAAELGSAKPKALPTTIHSQEGGTADLRSFMAMVKPSSSVSEIPALLYWAKLNEGREHFREKDVIELYRRAGMRSPKDVNQSFRDLCKRKYFRLESVPGERGAYRLSRAGEDFVIHDLLPKEGWGT